MATTMRGVIVDRWLPFAAKDHAPQSELTVPVGEGLRHLSDLELTIGVLPDLSEIGSDSESAQAAP
jgi:hypothetical protein